MASPQYPTKTRELHNHHFDSTVWNGFPFRDDDIVISTYAKSGTTWVQQIISQLLFNGEEGLPVADMSPWLDLRVPPNEVKLAGLEAQAHRRFIKTHLPVDYMKRNADLSVPLAGAPWDGGARTFIHKGQNGRWRDLLTDDDSARYDARARAELGSECAQWLASGELA